LLPGRNGSIQKADLDENANVRQQLNFLQEVRHNPLLTRLYRLFLREFYHTVVPPAKLLQIYSVSVKRIRYPGIQLQNIRLILSARTDIIGHGRLL